MSVADPGDRVPPPRSNGSGQTQNFFPGPTPGGVLGGMLQGDGISVPFGAPSGGGGGWVFLSSRRGGPAGGQPGMGVIVERRTVDQLMQEFYGSWDQKRIFGVGRKLVAAGWIRQEDSGNVAAIGEAYEKVLGLAASMYGGGSGREVTPEDVLNRWIGGPGSLGGGGGAPARPSSYTEVTKSIDLTNPKSARALLRQSLQQRLGRDPSAAEQQAFLASLNAAEREDPTVRTTKYKLDPATGQYNVENQTTEGGLDAGAYTGDYGEKHNEREYGAFQAAGTYMPALMQAIGAPVQ